jgi:hypothetical protein
MDGYHNDDDIITVVTKLFDMPYEQAATKVEELKQKAIELELVEEMPDIMLGRDTFHRGTEEEIYRSSRWERGESAYRQKVGVEDQYLDEGLKQAGASASPV